MSLHINVGVRFIASYEKTKLPTNQLKVKLYVKLVVNML